MGFLSLPTSSKPRKLSRKQKAQLAQEKEIQKKNKESRKDYWKKAPAHIPSDKYIPDRNSHLNISDSPTVAPKLKKAVQIEYSDEMIERERIARLHSEELKKQTAPLYNKGPYQFIGEDPEIIKNLGKKL